jgi:hypothetical protein
MQPADVALYYVALGRRQALRALYTAINEQKVDEQ